ncbi:MAG: tyrosine-type recombinase/integrase [Eubacteriales bacterium]|nr:tyrosine-type recombinase/integrase [Eubacteriales bacterium]
MKEIKDWITPFLTHCKFQRGLAENSIRNYGFDLEFFLRFLEKEQPGLKYCHQVTKKTLEDYLTVLSQKYKVKTIKRKMACLQSFFTYLEGEEIVRENPFAKFRIRLKEGYRKPKSMTLKEMSLFLQTVYEDPFSMSAGEIFKKLGDSEIPRLAITSGEFIWCRDVAILELLFGVGLRVSELCNLRFEDYDREECSFRIIGKGNRERMLYLENSQALNALDNYLLVRQGVDVDLPFIFITKFRGPMSTQGVRNMVTKYTKRAGIQKNITPHVFRHSFATLLLESGVDIKFIQDFLGHSSITTTQIYLHLSNEQKRKVLATKHPRDQMHPIR